MRILIMILLLLVSGRTSATCNINFTDEQYYILRQAYAVGKPYDLGHTLAALVWKESFVGRYTVRINNQSGATGSYGITHIQLTTAMWFTGEKDIWKARSEIIPKLMSDDSFALQLGVDVLLDLKRHKPTYKELLSAYNGGWGGRTTPNAIAYGNDTATKAKQLKACRMFE